MTICLQYANPVAPRVGAWIETLQYRQTPSEETGSHPVWVRGLKRAEESHILDMGGVAPRVGAWIETAR